MIKLHKLTAEEMEQASKVPMEVIEDTIVQDGKFYHLVKGKLDPSQEYIFHKGKSYMASDPKTEERNKRTMSNDRNRLKADKVVDLSHREEEVKRAETSYPSFAETYPYNPKGPHVMSEGEIIARKRYCEEHLLCFITFRPLATFPTQQVYLGAHAIPTLPLRIFHNSERNLITIAPYTKEQMVDAEEQWKQHQAKAMEA
jgi:hypothetical protein